MRSSPLFQTLRPWILVLMSSIFKAEASLWTCEFMERYAEKLPVSISSAPQVVFCGFAEYERLVEATGKLDWCIQFMMLLGGDAGLRCGEITALE